MRSSVRSFALTIACVTLAAVALAFGPRVWVRTNHGHRTVERVLTHILNTRVPGWVSTGRLSGDVFTGLRAEEVVVRNPDGAVIGRAHSLTARWRPLALLRHRKLEEVLVEQPSIALDRARWEIPPEDAARTGPSRDIVVARIIALDGQVSWKRTTFTRVTGSAALHSLSHLDVPGVSASVAGNVLYAFGTVGWGRRPAWVATRFAVKRPARLHARGEIFYTRGQLEGDLEELTVAAPVATRLVGGRGPVRLRGRVEGSGESVRTEARAEQGARSLQLRISIDPARSEAQIAARLAGVPRPIRLRARARYRQGAIALSALHATVGGSRLDANGTLARESVRLDLRVRLLPSEARLFRLQPAAPVLARLRANGPSRALSVHGLVELEAAQLLVRGRVNLSSHAGALRLIARSLQPDRLVRGAPPGGFSGTVDLAGRVARRALVGTVRVQGATARVGGQRFSDVAAYARVRLARNGEISFRRLAGQWRSRRFDARGALRWGGQLIETSGADVELAGAHAHGDARYRFDDHHLSVRAAPLSLSQPLVSRLLRRPARGPWTGRVDLEGTPGDVTMAVDTVTSVGPLRLGAHLLRTGASVDLRRVEAWLGDSHLLGAGRYQDGRIVASVEELVLSPSLVHHFAPELTPAWPIHVRGVLAGRQVLHVSLALDAGPSSARVRGRIAARQFRLSAHLDTFDVAALRPNDKRVRATLELTASGRFEQGGAVGTLNVRDARGYFLESPFYRGVADVRLEGRGFTLTHARAEIPGAKLIGRGSGVPAKGLEINFGVVITNALELRHTSQALRVLIGINSMLPGRSVSGSIIKRPGEKAELKYRVLPIGVAQVAFLLRVLTDRVPRLQTGR